MIQTRTNSKLVTTMILRTNTMKRKVSGGESVREELMENRRKEFGSAREEFLKDAPKLKTEYA